MAVRPLKLTTFLLPLIFGGSGAWSSMFHLHNLMERQQYLPNKDTTIADNLFLSQQNSESDFSLDIRQHDINTRKCLSTYTYKEYWIKVIQKRIITNISCIMKEGIILYGLLDPYQM